MAGTTLVSAFSANIQRSFMKNNIKIYGVKDAYIKYLSQYQAHLFLHENGSFGRKYIGTVLEIDGFFYFAPLSSFKSKHKKIKESEVPFNNTNGVLDSFQ